MSLWAACTKCGYRDVVPAQRGVDDLQIAGALAREHALSEHFELISVDVEAGGQS